MSTLADIRAERFDAVMGARRGGGRRALQEDVAPPPRAFTLAEDLVALLAAVPERSLGLLTVLDLSELESLQVGELVRLAQYRWSDREGRPLLRGPAGWTLHWASSSPYGGEVVLLSDVAGAAVTYGPKLPTSQLLGGLSGTAPERVMAVILTAVVAHANELLEAHAGASVIERPLRA